MAEPTRIGKYVIESTLGQGGMGIVYRAFDPILERPVALKLMLAASGGHEEERGKRFLREARSAAKLHHPNIVAVYEMGEQEGQVFVAMEYVEGEDLHTLIRNRTLGALDQRLDLVQQICVGLQFAHEHGIVHRDIKPANVRVTPTGVAKIMDFGIARLTTSELTQTGAIMGTPQYMSPEQIRGEKNIDGRTDLFSTGVILFELVAGGVKPFEGDNMNTLLYRIVAEPPTRLSEVVPDVAPELEEMVERCLAKAPADRFPDCHALALAIGSFRATLPEHAGGSETREAPVSGVRRSVGGKTPVPPSAGLAPTRRVEPGAGPGSGVKEPLASLGPEGRPPAGALDPDAERTSTLHTGAKGVGAARESPARPGPREGALWVSPATERLGAEQAQLVATYIADARDAMATRELGRAQASVAKVLALDATNDAARDLLVDLTRQLGAPGGQAKPSRVPARPRGLFLAGSLIAAAALVVAVVFSRRAGERPSTTSTGPEAIPAATNGTLVLDPAPWAEVRDVRSKTDGTGYAAKLPAASGAYYVTPVRFPLPPGVYHVVLANPELASPLEVDVTVEPGREAIVRRSLPGFELDHEVAAALEATAAYR